MKRILVTTDFSADSIAALRFAMQLASCGDYELTLYHACHYMKPTVWSEHAFNAFKRRECTKLRKKLSRLVDSVNKKRSAGYSQVKYIVSSILPVATGIAEYAAENKFDFICMSTGGAGRLKRLLGSTAGSLIQKCDIPIITVPADYETDAITKVVYVSDLFDLETEIPLAADFADSIHTELVALHFQGIKDLNVDEGLTNQLISQLTDYPVRLQLKNLHAGESLVINIINALADISPSVLIMFTQHRQDIVEKILFPSYTIEYMFRSKIPLLILRKP